MSKATVQKYKRHRTISCLSGSGRPNKVTTEMLKLIQSHMKEDNKTTAAPLIKLMEAQGYKVSEMTITKARRILGWMFHGSQYCQIIQAKTKKRE